MRSAITFEINLGLITGTEDRYRSSKNNSSLKSTIKFGESCIMKHHWNKVYAIIPKHTDWRRRSLDAI